MTVESYQNVMIGSGEAGKILAWNLAKIGQKTIVVERSLVGGACPNVACLPSKNVIHSAKAVSLVHPTKGLGVVTGSPRVDMEAVARRKREMVAGLAELHFANFKASGAELVMGEARFWSPCSQSQTSARALPHRRVFQPARNSFSGIIGAPFSIRSQSTPDSARPPRNPNELRIESAAFRARIWMN